MFSKIIMGCLLLFSLLVSPQRISVDDPHIKTVDEHIQDIFGNKAKIARAVLIHESEGMKLDAKNYNCRYTKTDKNGKLVVYSTFCKKEDRAKAWSVDCGIGQINVKGTVCPKRLLTLEGNMEAVEKIYKEQGLKAWVSYTTGRYKKYL